MKTRISFSAMLPSASFAWIVVLAYWLTGCGEVCETTTSYVAYEPVYTTAQALRDSVEIVDPRDINNPGRIYLKDGFLFINEAGAGIHIIDNRVVSSPKKLAFIEIPGNYDLAAKGNYLYADSYIDLLVFDISDLNNITEVNRIESVFENYYAWNGLFTESLGVITSWTEQVVETTYDSDCNELNNCINCYVFNDFMMLESFRSNLSKASSGGSFSSDAGVGGSMARFTISGDYMYTLDASTLQTFDITTIDAPASVSSISVGWGMETLFPYGDHLFMGAQAGMHIYSIETPDQPSAVSVYEHINSCDPVVVQDNYAYVTLRSGNECNGFTNQLEVIDISDLENPRLVNTVAMSNPHGLGIDGSCLFVCEGDFGLKLFDATDVSTIADNMLHHFDNIHALDVIPFNNVLMMIGNDGLKQYSYNCETGQMDLISIIDILPL